MVVILIADFCDKTCEIKTKFALKVSNYVIK